MVFSVSFQDVKASHCFLNPFAMRPMQEQNTTWLCNKIMSAVISRISAPDEVFFVKSLECGTTDNEK
jgi:hypothetical protein